MPASINPADNFTRRRFLLQALGFSAAGLAIGGGSAWAKAQMEEGAAAEAALAELRAQLGASTPGSATVADVVAALQSQLASATGQNGQLASALSTTQQEIANLKSQLAAAQGNLGAATDSLNKHRELVTLFDQLNGVDLDGVLQGGLAAAAGGLSTALALGPLVTQGVTLGRNLLASFEQTLPGLRDAMTWLGDQVLRLRLGLYAIEAAARQTINAALSGIATVFGGFISFVLDYLPFNIGANVKATLNATQSLLTGLVEVLDGTDQKVLGIISPLVSAGPQDLAKTLVEPLREQSLKPAGQLVMALGEADQTFKASLESPARLALAQRAEIRARIAAYRQSNRL